MSPAEQRYYRYCMLNDKPYFGTILRASQGSPIRHAYMRALIESECRSRDGKPFYILEIGSWAGGSAITWANALREFNGGKGMVICLDPWRLYFNPDSYSDLPDSDQYIEMAKALSSGEIYELFLHNIRSSGNKDLIVPFRGTSAELLDSFTDGKFDLIFVDGAHDYENARFDIANSARLVCEGGILCGDDLELQVSELNVQHAKQHKDSDYILDPQKETWYHPGVSLAVGEFFGEVSAWEGFWSMRKQNGTWVKLEGLDLNAGVDQIPEHMKDGVSSESRAVSPELVEPSYNGYNIVLFGHTYYALALSLGEVHLAKVSQKTLSSLQKRYECFIGSSAEEVKKLIDKIMLDKQTESDTENGSIGRQSDLGSRSVKEKMQFSRERCLRYDGCFGDYRFLSDLLDCLREAGPRIALYGSGWLCTYIINLFPEFKDELTCIIDDKRCSQARDFDGIPIVSSSEITSNLDAALLCTTRWSVIQKMWPKLPHSTKKLTLDQFAVNKPGAIPEWAWVSAVESIYPIDIPEIRFLPNQDVILLDMPARTIAQMPAGFAHIHNAMKKTGLSFQTVDMDNIIYHRYHSHRILDGNPEVTAPDGTVLPEDPWLPGHYLEWEKSYLIEYFRDDINEIIDGLIHANPKIIGISIQQANISFAKEVVKGVRQGLPDLVVVVGGMSCLQPLAAKMIFPDADYSVVGEAELIVGPLMKALAGGERPFDMPGVWSRFDTPSREFTPGPIVEDLDSLDPPRYEWTDVRLYRNYNGSHLVPIIGSRGCPWAKCRFCGERFRWRTRNPIRIVDELEWLYSRGFNLFVFNESDLHGDPKLVEQMCDEIIRRGLKIRMTAQLRCHPKVDERYFRKLGEAGFGCLRFGIDGGSTHILTLERKGYTKKMIHSNLRDCTNAGVFTEVNLVIGVPGETDQDVDETIAFLLELRPYIGRVAFINPLMLFRGSDYWDRPEDFGIVFRSDKDLLYSSYPVAIPDDEWYSTGPYIDKEVRYARLKKVVDALRQAGIPLGGYVESITDHLDNDLATSANPKAQSQSDLSTKSQNISGDGEPFAQSKIESIHKTASPGTTAQDVPPGEKIPDGADNIMERYKGFNVYLFESRYFAIPEDCRIEGIESLKKDAKVVSLSILELKIEIEKLCSSKDADHEGAGAGRQKALFVCNVIPDHISRYLDELMKDYDLTLLSLFKHEIRMPSFPVIHLPEDPGLQNDVVRILRDRNFDLVIIPYEGKTFWDNAFLENFARSFCNRIMTIYPDGRPRIYRGEDIHRVMYNKANIASMLRHVKDLKGKRLLEVGCSDGLVCDMLLSDGPEHITGIDVMESAGCSYNDPRLNFASMDAINLRFEDDSYDVSYSIATLEHCKDPLAAMEEMKRVTRPGGYVFVQAAPLYHSPFGHHMFGYFDHYPWIHLRLSKEEIIRYSKETGIDKKVMANLGLSIDNYISGVLNIDHVNGKRISEYRLDQFMASPDIEVLSFTKSYEGENLLTESILKEIKHIGREDLITHGFELVFKVREENAHMSKHAPGAKVSDHQLPARKTPRHSAPVEFSFLLPTRGRPDLVSRFFQSIVDTTSSLENLEIVLAIDEDDLPTQKVSHDKLSLKKVIVPRGLTMGALNNACFEASSGRFVMLVNDDIILRTKGWDDVVSSCFSSFGDDIGLIHVNDLLFRDVLCTFPFISRRACMEIGLCPAEYSRYKIDDHIYDLYNLLAHMGHKRITYLPDVIFEHENHCQPENPNLKHAFKSTDNKFYLPDQGILEQDDAVFLRSFHERKEAALKLAAIIEGDKYRRIMESRRKAQTYLLEGTGDPYGYRKGDFITRYSQLRADPQACLRTTVAVVTADIRSEFSSRCISLLKQHTSNFDLMVLDNNRDKGFSHPREMNKVLRNIDTDLLVLMDDDVFVEPGWLEGLVSCLDDRTAVVTPMHRDKDGNVNFTGAYLAGDGFGNHEHTFDVPLSPRPMQCYCSAAMLIDMRKCGHILMDESYRKYYFDLVHGLEVWEAGYRAVCNPQVAVTHICGATAVRGSALCNQLYDLDRQTFIKQWVDTGRLAKLEQDVWLKDPYIASLVKIPRKINELSSELSKVSLNDFIPRIAHLLCASFETMPHGNNLFVQSIEKVLSDYISLLVTRGDYAAGRSCLSSLLEHLRCNGTKLEEFNILTNLESMQINVSVAIDRFERAQDLKQQAMSRHTRGDSEGAEQNFLRALELAPRDSGILAGLGRIYYESHRYEHAMKYNQAAIQFNPKEIEAWIGLALIARHVNNPDVFKSACEQVGDLNPHHPMYKEFMRELH